MKLGMQVGLGPGHIVLNWDPAPLPKEGRSPQFSAHICCGQMHGCIDQDATWYAAMTRPRQLCVRWRPSSPPQFSAHVHCGQTAGWIKIALSIEVGLGPSYIVLDWDPAPLPKRGQRPPPNFRPISIVVKRLDASRCNSVRR